MIKNVKELKSLIKKNSPKGLGTSLFLVGPSLRPNPIITPASSFTTILNIQEYMF